jgi:hypothetical protein
MTESKRPVRFEVVEGSTIDAMRDNFKKTELYKQGDALLVWANEGDLFDPAPRATGDDGELVEWLLKAEMDLAGHEIEEVMPICLKLGQAADRITALSTKVAEWKDWHETYFPMMQKQDMELRMEITRLRNQVEALGAKP